MSLNRVLSLSRSKNISITAACAKTAAVFAWLTILLTASNLLVASQTTHAVEEIADALLASEAQFSNLKLTYSINRPGVDKYEGKRAITRATFARKMPEGWLYLDRKGEILDPVTNQSKVDPGDLTVFNRKTTLHLYRESDSSAPVSQMRAVIFPGREERLGKNFVDTPYKYVYSYGAPYGEIIKKSNDIKIVSQSEEVNGYKAIKLVGTVFSGVATMTLWLCPEMNFLPLKVQFVRHKDNRIMQGYSTSDFVKLPNGLFFPKKITFGDPNSSAHWTTMTISDISIDPIPEEFFQPSLPPNTHVTDHVLSIAYTTTDADDLGLKELPSLENEAPEEAVTQQNPAVSQKALEDYLAKANGQRAKETVEKTSAVTRIEPLTSTVQGTSQTTAYSTLAIVMVVLFVLAVGIICFLAAIRLKRKAPLND
jgi:hypothetical protein